MTTFADADLEQVVRLLVSTAGIDIPSTSIPIVIDNVRILMAHAALVMSSSVADEIDIGRASMFEP